MGIRANLHVTRSTNFISFKINDYIKFDNYYPLPAESRLYLDGQMKPPKIRKKVMIRKAVLSLSVGPFDPSYFLYDTGEFVIWVQ